MGSKRFNHIIHLRVGFIGLATLTAAYLWFSPYRIYGILPLILLSISLVRLSRFLKRSNQDLALFFEGLLNEDSSFIINRKEIPPGFEYLSNTLSRLSKTIRDERIRSRFQQQFYEELINHSTTGLLAYDETGQIKLANPPVLNTLGLHHLSGIKTVENRFPEFYQSIHQLQPGKTLVFKFSREGNTIPLQIRASVFSFGKKSYRLLAIQNIKNEMDEKEVESWQKLFRILSHEIMNSIAPITSLAQTISTSLPPDEEQNIPAREIDYLRIKRSAKTIEEQSKLMMSFVEKYRKLYKIPEPEIKPIQVEDWLSRFRILYHQEMNELGIRFEVRPTEVEVIYGDDNLLSQVIINLLRNAQQALTETGQATIRMAVEKKNEHVEISVEDNGAGIPEEYADQIFIPFFTTRSGGNGIGLAISRQIIHRHGGSISFSSIPGKGTKFYINL